MRGKVFQCFGFFFREGITPAYAGKSKMEGIHFNTLWDHPRVCGEKRPQAARPVPPQGSPPRMRGKAVVENPTGGFDGITPAYAGKSLDSPTWLAFSWDHPRVCGEKPQPELTPRGDTGSPPRMRGKAVGSRLRDSGDGITPAYAGKRRRYRSCWW